MTNLPNTIPGIDELIDLLEKCTLQITQLNNTIDQKQKQIDQLEERLRTHMEALEETSQDAESINRLIQGAQSSLEQAMENSRNIESQLRVHTAAAQEEGGISKQLKIVQEHLVALETRLIPTIHPVMRTPWFMTALTGMSFFALFLALIK